MIDCTVNSRIGVITLNRPEKLNALNLEMFLGIQNALDQWESNPDVDIVVIRSSFSKAFSAGGDLRIVYDSHQNQSKEQAVQELGEFFQFEYSLNARIYHFPKPFISLIDGIAMGGGLGVSIHGSHRIVTEDIRMAMPECAIGFFPDVGSSHFLSQCPGHLGTFLGVTGYQMSAADALYTGIATHHITRDLMPIFLETLYKAPTEYDPQNVLAEILECFVSTQLPMLSELQEHREIIDEAFSENTLEEAFSILTLSKDRWVWKILDKMEEDSPLSLKVAFHLLKKATAGKSFDDLNALDWTLSHNFLKTNEFVEGIRAKIIDKDNNPQWQFKSLSDVPEKIVQEFFA